MLFLWYLFSILIGLLLAFIGFVLAFVTIPILMICIKEAIDMDNKRVIKYYLLFGLFSFIFCTGTYWINYTLSEENHIVSEEIPNIIIYNGVGNEKNGKYTNEYFYFEQGTKNDSTVYKVPQSGTQIHHTGTQNIKILKNHTEYTSFYRYFAILSLEENVYYDIYIP